MRRVRRLFPARAVRRSTALTASALLAATAFAVIDPSPAYAAGGPFVCQPGFYQVISGQLKELNPVTGAYQAVGVTNGTYNAIGYDTQDNYLYGISTAAGNKGNLIRIADDGSLTDLGTVSGMPTGLSIVSGDFDDNGNLIVQTGATQFYSINVATRTATGFTTTGVTASTNDMVWINGTVYGMTGTTLYAVNLSTHVSTSATVSGVTSGSFGAGWSDNPNELFFSDNNTGHIYKITNFTTSSPTGALESTAATTGNNDGAACKNADSPFNPPTGGADSYTPYENTALTVSASDGVLANDTGSVLSATRDAGPSHGSLTLNNDGSFSYTPASGYLGTDSFSYTATDQYGRSTTSPVTVTLTVVQPPAPVAADDSYTLGAGSSLSVNATSGVLNNDTGTGNAVTSNTDPSHGVLSVAADGSFSYTPSSGFSGSDTFDYTISDEYSRTATATVALRVTPAAAADSYSVTGGTILHEGVTGGVLGNDSGADLSASVVSQPTHGTLTLAADGSFDYQPTAGYTGSDSFSYAATDSANQTTAASTVTIGVVAPAAPSASDDSYSRGGGSSWSVTGTNGLLANDTGTGIAVTSATQPTNGSVTVDPDGSFVYTPPSGYSGSDTFGYTITDAYDRTATAVVTLDTTPVTAGDAYNLPSDTTLIVHAADGVLANDTGSNLTAAIGSQPSHGALTLNSDGSFTYTPGRHFGGADSFTYIATDGSNQNSAATTVTIGVNLPGAPVAADDAYGTSAGSVLTANAGSGSLLNNDTGTDVAVTAYGQPAHGSVSVNADGSFSYIPSSGFSGADTFGYTITDAYNRTSEAVATVQVPPVVAADAYLTTAGTTLHEDAALGVLGNDSGSNLAATVGSRPTHGTLTFNSNGSFDYRPDAGYTGSDSFSYTATDSAHQTSAAATVSLTIAPPAAPSASDDSYSSGAGSALSVNGANGLLANDTGTGITITSVTQPAHGSVTVKRNGAFTYTPPTGFSGSDTFGYTISDVYDQLATATVMLRTTPVTAGDTYSLISDTTLTVHKAEGVLATDSGSDLTVTSHSRTAHGSLTMHADGSFRYRPAATFHGTDTFSYVATDGHGQSASPTTVTITVALPPAPAAGDDAYGATGGSTLTVAAPGVLGNDSGSSVTVLDATQPGHGTLSVTATGAFTYTAPSDYSGTTKCTYTIVDAYGRTASATLAIAVTPHAAFVRKTSSSEQTPAGTTLTVPASSGLLAGLSGAHLTIRTTSRPAHGTLTVHADGGYSYVPHRGYHGADKFSYVVRNAAGRVVARGIVHVTVTPSRSTSGGPHRTQSGGSNSAGLAATGVDVLGLGADGVLLVAVGLFLLLLARRRRDVAPH